MQSQYLSYAENKQTKKQTYNKEITTLHKELGRKLHINAK
jgi:hypothetical protein